MKKNIAALFLTLLAFGACGQNIQTTTIQWKSSLTFNVNDGNTFEEHTTILSTPDRIEWRASTGTIKYTLNILETNGSWTNISNNGQITFEVDSAGKRGTVLFRRDSSKVLVRLILLNGETPDFIELTITETTTL